MKGLLKYGLSIVLLGVSFAVSVNAQTITDPSNQRQGTGNRLNYPSGTRIYPDGRISTPRSGIIYPSVVVPRGDGSTTYYYPNGTHITVEGNAINPTGTTLSPGTNGGLRNNTIRNPEDFLQNPNILPRNR